MVGAPPGVEACAAPPLDVDASDPLVFGLFLVDLSLQEVPYLHQTFSFMPTHISLNKPTSK